MKKNEEPGEGEGRVLHMQTADYQVKEDGLNAFAVGKDSGLDTDSIEGELEIDL